MDKPDAGRPARRLGFREIVPGRDDGPPQDSPAQAQVPDFDLTVQIMANDRKLVSATRRGPGRSKRTASDGQAVQDEAVPQQPSQEPVRRPSVIARVWRPALPDPQRQVIAQIVARDIEWLCRGG
jgi:hypothetical protein